MSELEIDDMQRLLVQGYKERTHAAYALLRIVRPDQARAWLRHQLNDVGHGGREGSRGRGDRERPEQVRLAIAFSFEGLSLLGLPQAGLDSFIPEFRQGMAHPVRSRVLGDVGDNAPARWLWGSDERPTHVLYMAYSTIAERTHAKVQADCFDEGRDGVVLVDVVHAVLAPNEPFGFQDGISQPQIEGFGGPTDRAASLNNRIEPGEIVLGYPNELGVRPASPWVEPGHDPNDRLAAVPFSGRKDFGRNGSFLVARELAQEIETFQARLSAHESAEARQLLAAKMVGRFPNGTPLELSRGPLRATRETANDFAYAPEDRDGLRCPVGAHIRRANPRDALADPVLDVTPEQAVKLANQHRILRRGRSYTRPAEANQNGSKGLFFLCLNANLERQFEFVQQTWVMNPKFGGLYHERDPLLGGHLPGPRALGAPPVPQAPFMSIPDCTGRTRIEDLHPYVKVRGGGYFFMPGMRALRYLAELDTAAASDPAGADS